MKENKEEQNIKTKKIDINQNKEYVEKEQSIIAMYYYRFQNLLCPIGSKRRRTVSFIYRSIKGVSWSRIKKAAKYIKSYGLKSSIRKMYLSVMNRAIPGRDMQSAYLSWISNNEPTDEELKNQRKTKFKNNIKLSILVPMYNTPETFFKELIDSLKMQTYSNWELCLADGSEKKPDFIDKYIKSDTRIKYNFLNSNKGISENTNSALKVSTGDYIGLLDHDDILPPFSLFEVVKAINENNNVDFLYTDEDKIADGIGRYDPHFKPDFSPFLLRSYNYITHFSIFKTQFIRELGGFRKEYDGSQDYDLVLRATEKANQIVHIPKILYHWRVHPGSVASSSSAKTYAYDAGKKAIEEQLSRLSIDATVEHEFSLGLYKVNYKVVGQPRVSIIIPNKDSIYDLKKCIKSLLKCTYSNLEIIIVENNSTNKNIFKYYENIQKKYKNIKVVSYKTKEFNYSKINNFAVKSATGQFLLFLNNDTEIINNDFIEQMLSINQIKNVGIVGAKLLYPDNLVQHAGVVIGIGGIAGHINKLIDKNDIGYYARASVINNYSAVTAACLMIKKELFQKVGGFTEELVVAFNDIDLCLKVRTTGEQIIYTPYATCYHYESKSRGLEDTPEKIKRFKKEAKIFTTKWSDIIEKGDPYFNKNFRLDMPIYFINAEKVDENK